MKEETRGKSILKCDTHNKLTDWCVKQIALHGEFNKKEALAETGFAKIAGAVKWHLIVANIERDHGMAFLPVWSLYFNRHSKKRNPHKWTVQLHPEKFLAGRGHGRAIAGYVRVDIRNADLVRAKVQERESVANGTTKFAEAFRELYKPIEQQIKQTQTISPRSD